MKTRSRRAFVGLVAPPPLDDRGRWHRSTRSIPLGVRQRRRAMQDGRQTRRFAGVPSSNGSGGDRILGGRPSVVAKGS